MSMSCLPASMCVHTTQDTARRLLYPLPSPVLYLGVGVHGEALRRLLDDGAEGRREVPSVRRPEARALRLLLGPERVEALLALEGDARDPAQVGAAAARLGPQGGVGGGEVGVEGRERGELLQVALHLGCQPLEAAAVGLEARHALARLGREAEGFGRNGVGGRGDWDGESGRRGRLVRSLSLFLPLAHLSKSASSAAIRCRSPWTRGGRPSISRCSSFMRLMLACSSASSARSSAAGSTAGEAGASDTAGARAAGLLGVVRRE